MARRYLNLKTLQFIISIFIRLTILAAIGGAIYRRRYLVFFVAVLTYALTFVPAIIRKNYKISLPTELELVMVLFIYASLFLGEIHGYYTRYWWWDVVLHTGSGIVLGFIGFLILFVLYSEQKIKAKPITIAFFSFCFALAIGALWEIFEFTMDSTFGTNMQKSGLVDTMWDLIVDAAGALFTSIIGFIYMKGRKTPIFERMLKRFFNENPKFLLGGDEK